MKMQPDDPLLTAFALGELEGSEHARVAAAVAADPALQAAVDEITSAAAQLTAALATEPAPAVAPIELPVTFAAPEHRTERAPARARLFQFPYVTIGSLAAACFAVAFFILNQDEHGSREANRHSAPVAESAEKPLAIALSPGPPETSPRILIPDTLPLAASETRETVISRPSPTPAVPAPAEGPATPATVAVAPVIPASPNTTPVTVLQTQPSTPSAAAGLSRNADANATSGSSLPAPAPTSTLAQNPRSFARQAPLPPSPGEPRSPRATENVDGYFAELFTEGAAAGDHLRTTFRDFGARYATNQATPAAGTGSAAAPSVAFAAGETKGTNGTAADVTALTDAATRPSEENIKTDGARPRRIPYEQPVVGSQMQAELNSRGTMDQGSRIADLETQLRDLQGTNGALDSPVQDFVRDNAFVSATENPASVFPVVVDSASYVNVRRALLAGVRPSRDIVRIEELLNVHEYDYAAAAPDGDGPFAATLEVASAPWSPPHRLVRVGLKARDVTADARPAGHFVVLVETGEPGSGGSQFALIKESLRQFIEQLGPLDEVAIVQHDSTTTLALPTTSARDRATILAAIDQLRATGAATGSTGLELAYDIARSRFVTGGINRVVLASDGDKRLGEARRDDAVRLIDAQAQLGIAFSAVGFGVREIRDSVLEQIAHFGVGEVAFVDTPRDAQRALSDRAGSAFTPVAHHVKLQVEFNPARVESWRLIGYEDRVFLREDFDHENLTANAVGAGHTITALFEIVPLASPPPSTESTIAIEGELLSVKVRSTVPGDDTARLQQFALTDSGQAFADASGDFKFAAAVAGFGMILRDSPHRGTVSFADIAAWARAGLGSDRTGTRAEFIDLVDRAGRIAR